MLAQSVERKGPRCNVTTKVLVKCRLLRCGAVLRHDRKTNKKQEHQHVKRVYFSQSQSSLGVEKMKILIRQKRQHELQQRCESATKISPENS